jgi:hypothetical protein
MSLTTPVSLMLASSSAFWTRCVLRATSRTNCLRVRISARKVVDGRRRHEAAADQAMGQEVCDPGRVLHIGLATGHVLDVRRVRQNQLELRFQNVQTGFQYAPVASIATCVHPCDSSHDDSSSRPVVVVSNVRTSSVTLLSSTMRAHATTVR